MIRSTQNTVTAIELDFISDKKSKIFFQQTRQSALWKKASEEREQGRDADYGPRAIRSPRQDLSKRLLDAWEPSRPRAWVKYWP